MKIITLSKIGYNHPSGANWNYGIWKIDLIDTRETWCTGITVTEQFGGEYRFCAEVEKQTGHHVIQTKQVYTSTGTPKITGIRGLLDIESEDVMDIVTDFLGRKN